MTCVLVLDGLDVLWCEAPVPSQVLPIARGEHLLGKGPGQPLHLLLLLLPLLLCVFSFGGLLSMGLIAGHTLLLDVHQAVAELTETWL